MKLYSRVYLCLFFLMLSGCSHLKPANDLNSKSVEMNNWKSAIVKNDSTDIPEVSSVKDDINLYGTSIEFIFSQNMQRVSPESIRYEISPSVPCEWQWNDQRRLECVLESGLVVKPATKYTLTLIDGLYNSEGVRLKPYSYEFETPRPEISYINIEWSSPTLPIITANFNLSVEESSLVDALYLEDESGKKVALTVSKIDILDGDHENEVWNKDSRWKLTTTRTLLPDTLYALKQTGGIRTPLGDLVSYKTNDENERHRFKTYGDFEFLDFTCREKRDCPPNRSIALNFSAPINSKDVEKCKVELKSQGVNLEQGAWYVKQPENIVVTTTFSRLTKRLTCLESIRDIFGRKLNPKRPILITTGDFASTDFNPFYYETVTKSEELKLYHYSLNNPFLTFEVDELDFKKVEGSSVIKNQKIGLSSNDNKMQKVNLISEPLKHANSIGGVVRTSKKSWDESHVFVQKSNYNAIVVQGSEDTLVFLSDIKTNKPISNMKFSVSPDLNLRKRDSVNLTSKTDMFGIAKLPSLLSEEKYKDSSRLYFTLDNGEKFAVLLRNSLSKTLFKDEDDYDELDSERVFWGVPDKPLYRSGEKVKFVGFLRKINGSKLQITEYPDSPLLYVYGDNNDCDEYRCNSFYINKKLEIDEFGRVSGEFTIPKSVLNGTYTIYLSDGEFNAYIDSQLNFEISNFKPKKLNVTVSPLVKGTLTSKQFKVLTKAEYYSGGPYKDAESEVAVVLEARKFKPSDKRFQEYIFSPNSSYRARFEPASHYYSGGKLNSNGQSVATLEIPNSEINYGAVSLMSTVFTDEGESVLSRPKTFDYSKKSYYVGIKKLKWWLPINEEIELNSRVVNLDGEEVSGVAVKYFTQESSGFFNRRDNSDAASKKVEIDCLVKTNGSKQNSATDLNVISANTCVFKAQRKGLLKLIAEITYPDGTTQSSFSEHYFFEDSSLNDDVVVNAEKIELSIGERAKLELRHGFKDASALVVIHRSKIIDYWWQPLKSGISKLENDISEELAPGFNMTVFVNYGDLSVVKSTKNANFAPVVSQRFKVQPKKKAPIVKIENSVDEYKPGETIKIKLINHSDKKATVALAVVDESILEQKNDNQYYRYDKSYYGSVELGWSNPSFYELASSLYSSNRLEESFISNIKAYDASEMITITGSRIKRTAIIPFPPDESVILNDKKSLSRHQIKDGYIDLAKLSKIDLKSIRRLFSDSAFWDSNIQIMGNADTEVQVTLPDNLTRWKVIAISTDESGDIYSDTHSFRTASNIEVHAEMPGQLIEGDELVFQAEFLSKLKKQVVVNFNAFAKMMSEKLTLNKNELTFKQVKPFSRHKISLDLSTKAIGELGVLSVARSNEVRDALLLTTNVYSKELKRKVSKYSLLPDDNQFSLEVPNDFSSKEARVLFNLSGSRMSSLNSTFEYMREYPHQCWEQKLSRAIVAAIEKQYSDAYEKELNAILSNAIDSVADFQSEDGGMSFFGNSSSTVNTYLTAFTFKQVNYLQGLGYDFPESKIAALERYLFNKLKHQKDLSIEHAIIIVNALSSASNNKAFIKPYIEPLMASFSELDIYSQSLLIETISEYQELSGQLEKIMKQFLAETLVTDKKRTFTTNKRLPWSYYSFTNKTYCAAISALSKANANKKTVNQLVNSVLEMKREKKGDFGNTLSNAYCSKAIDSYVSKYEQKGKLGEYSIRFQNNEIQLNALAQKAHSQINLDEPLDITVNMKEMGTAYLTTMLEYSFDGSTAKQISNGFALHREYSIFKDGKWINTDNEKLRQGEIVKVTLNLNNPVLRRNIALTDSLPGTFFALDENLALSAPRELYESLINNYYFNEKQYSVRNVKFYADFLPAGTYTIEYLVRVTHKGSFTALSAKVEEMYDDDVFATSKPDIVDVK
ncbi:alpha-2-macroglobulin family protein [Pleionea litopenaei]|uniref:Alpha-2-macroglobulin family protein n=1 Tax=Pleionea litopenaei TaxID=3070815 RepID=A0AA51X7F6_9GAMM|nr:alpha-2-macroglobulin family protein [Pleionea sp. HL-JVS1]WMS87864.1 alpha-2-macroglobulin family protein [Pleionea sp. HL-JVS1]